VRESIAGIKVQRGTIRIACGIVLTGGAQSLTKHNPPMRHRRRNRDSSLRHANGCIGLAAGKRDKTHTGKRFGVTGIAGENLLVALRYFPHARSKPQRLTCVLIQLL
jgi:hypothetical protein